MRARVTNLAGSARGFHAADGATAMVDPGASALLDLADHPAHDAWAEAGEVTIVPEPVPPRDGEGVAHLRLQDAERVGEVGVGGGRSATGAESFSRSREKVSRRSRDG